MALNLNPLLLKAKNKVYNVDDPMSVSDTKSFPAQMCCSRAATEHLQNTWLTNHLPELLKLPPTNTVIWGADLIYMHSEESAISLTFTSPTDLWISSYWLSFELKANTCPHLTTQNRRTHLLQPSCVREYTFKHDFKIDPIYFLNTVLRIFIKI